VNGIMEEKSKGLLQDNRREQGKADQKKGGTPGT